MLDSEIINKILFSSLITHYQDNKNNPARGYVRLPAQHKHTIVLHNTFSQKYFEGIESIWVTCIGDLPTEALRTKAIAVLWKADKLSAIKCKHFQCSAGQSTHM